MPARVLPTFTRAEVEAHKTEKSCFVTIGTNVYDVTDFLDSHPGGAQLILEYGGRDVGDILKDVDSHAHSEAAYEVLDESLVGFVVSDKQPAANGTEAKLANGAAPADFGPADGRALGLVKVVTADGKEAWVHPRTGMSSAEDLSKETDITTDYKTHKFLDLNRPLFMQVWRGGFSKKFYLEQVHRPRHYRGGQSAPLFGNFLEPLTKTPWWVIPTIWLPPVIYGTYLAVEGLGNPAVVALFWILGTCIWSFLEYVLHRFLFHLDE